MTRPTADDWWALLPSGIREQVDGYVLQDAFMRAVRAVFEAGRGRGLGLDDAQQVVSERYAHHGDRVARTPDSPLDLDSLVARASGCPGRILAIEAIWDGDTVHDWFVVLVAVTEEPDAPVKDFPLATIYWATGERHLAGADRGGLGPHAAAATRAGQKLAAHLGVPFHFASPDAPADEAPRWSGRRP